MPRPRFLEFYRMLQHMLAFLETHSAQVTNAAVGALITYGVWLLTRLHESWTTLRKSPYNVSGEWYSLEYVPKAEESFECNVLTRLRVRKALLGRAWKVEVLEQLRMKIGRASCRERV